MACNSCGNRDSEILCDDCLEIAQIGNYVICIKCGRISATFIDLDSGRNKRYFSATCRECEKDNPAFKTIKGLYLNPENAEKANDINNN